MPLSKKLLIVAVALAILGAVTALVLTFNEKCAPDPGVSATAEATAEAVPETEEEG